MLSGAIITASVVVSLFFIRFWRRTRDSFFLYFATAFFLEGITRLIANTTPLQDRSSVVYTFRIVAYLLIIYAIYKKNKSVE